MRLDVHPLCVQDVNVVQNNMHLELDRSEEFVEVGKIGEVQALQGNPASGHDRLESGRGSLWNIVEARTGLVAGSGDVAEESRTSRFTHVGCVEEFHKDK